MNESEIETGGSSPQISVRAWKSANWRALMFVCPFMGVFLFIGAFGFALEKAPRAVTGSIILGIVFCLLPLLISRAGHTRFRLGIDLKSNTLWTQLGSKKLRHYSDADRTMEFYVHGEKIRATGLGNVAFSGGSPRIRPTGSRKVYHLMIRRAGSIDWDVAALTTKREANEACAKANELLLKRMKAREG